MNGIVVEGEPAPLEPATMEPVVEVCDSTLEKDFTLAIVILLMTLLAAVLVARFCQSRSLSWLQSSSTSLILGVIVSAIALLANTIFSSVKSGEYSSQENIEAFDSFIAFDPSFFFIALVPPIIFNAGFTLESKYFFMYAGAFCTYAFLGTLISTFVIFALMLLLRLILGFGMTPLHSVLFGSLISATDPVTVLAIFTQLKVDRHLYMLVFGESVMNDAVAIVLFRTIMRFEPTECNPNADTVDAAAIFTAIGFFLLIFVGSTLIGFAVGLASALLFKSGLFRPTRAEAERQRPAGDHSSLAEIMEASTVILPPYISYMLAETLGLSGIVSILFCGIVMNHYTKWNLTQDTRHIIETFFEIIAYVAETFVFIYIGTVFFITPHRAAEIGFACLTLVVVLLSRACNIYPLTFLINRWRRREERVPFNQQHMLFFSGLRGGIAFALAIQANEDLGEDNDGRLILDCTLVIVLFTVWVNGGLTPRMLRLFKVKFGGIEEDDLELTNMVTAGAADGRPDGGGGGAMKYTTVDMPTTSLEAGANGMEPAMHGGVSRSASGGGAKGAQFVRLEDGHEASAQDDLGPGSTTPSDWGRPSAGDARQSPLTRVLSSERLRSLRESITKYGRAGVRSLVDGSERLFLTADGRDASPSSGVDGSGSSPVEIHAAAAGAHRRRSGRRRRSSTSPAPGAADTVHSTLLGSDDDDEAMTSEDELSPERRYGGDAMGMRDPSSPTYSRSI